MLPNFPLGVAVELKISNFFFGCPLVLDLGEVDGHLGEAGRWSCLARRSGDLVRIEVPSEADVAAGEDVLAVLALQIALSCCDACQQRSC